jgi:hypothetical protein
MWQLKNKLETHETNMPVIIISSVAAQKENENQCSK